MVQQETINTTQDYVNYTFNIETRGASMVAGELMGLSNTVNNILGDIAFKTSELLSHTEMMAMGVSVAIGGMFVSAAQSAVRFEQQMANVKAIGGESLNVQEIGDAAMEYSNKFGMATASMTEGLESLARAGITTTSVMKSVLEEGVKLSTLEGMDLEDSVNDLISTTNLLATNNVDMNDAKYAEMVKEMNQHIVSTSESAPINAQNIIQSLQHVGGYASASGLDQDDLFAVIAQLGARGTKGEMAGTALRAFIAAGQKDTAQRALARIGLDVSDLWNENGETMLSISEMKDVLDEALEARGYSKQEKLEFYSDFAGYKQANQIMKIDTSEVQQYREQIANAWDLGQKLNTILNTVHGNITRIWQISQNFMTKVGSKILFVANAVLMPVRVLLELFTKIPFADTGVAIGLMVVGFSGVLKVINNIVPRFSSFFMEISHSKNAMLDIKNIWRSLPDDIDRAKKTLKSVSNPQSMLEIQQQYNLYSRKDIKAIEDKVAETFYIEANWGNDSVKDLNAGEKKHVLSEAYRQADPVFRQDYVNFLKNNDPNAWENAILEYLDKTKAHARNTANNVSYDIGQAISGDTILESIDKYIKLIWGVISDSRGPKNNRERNAEERRESFNAIKDDVISSSSQYGDYSYKVNRDIGAPQFSYNNLSAMRAFEEQVLEDIRKKEEMYIRFIDDKSIEAGRNRLKKSLTVAAKTDLGYEFSTGSNTSDIKKILETGNIRPNSSHITDRQLQDIASVLNTNVTGDTSADMIRFYNILKNKNNKDALLNQILQKTQKSWNDEYYNNGRVGFFPTRTLEQASNGETARKIMEKVGVNSIAEVQEHFKSVQLDDALLNECVDIMYEDKELVDALVNEEIKYMYQNLVRVRNSIRRKENESEGFRSEGEYTNLQKAREYILSDFNPRDFENFSASPRTPTANIKDIIEEQNANVLYKYGFNKPRHEYLEGFQGFIYPIGGDIARSQRYGNDNFNIRNIKHVPYNKLLKENVEEVFLDREGFDSRIDFMTAFAEWVYELASDEGYYWEDSFNFNYARQNGFEGGQEKFDELKQEFEEIYRAYIDLAAYGAQSLIESTKLTTPTVSYRGGRLYTPVNEFGAFDTISSTSLVWDVANAFWNKNPSGRTIMEIYNPEENPGVIAHYDLLNDQNDHLWSRERELTLGKNQPYLHIPSEDMEKKLIMLTADQQKAVKEIMGEDFEFAPNTLSGQFTKAELEALQKKMQNAGFYNAGESDVPAMHNIIPSELNKDNLTKNNIAAKLQDFFANGSIIIGSKGYGQGFLGESDKGTIDIRPGVIKYYTDEDSEQWGEYGNTLLDTVIHEMTHTLMMHQERQNYKDIDSNIPAELGIDNFEIPQQLLGYRKNFVAEYEAQYVTDKIFTRLGLEISQKNQQRMNAFESLIKHKGYEDQIQYELLDQLVEDMLDNISTIGDITEALSTQFDTSKADITSAQISEDMRPVLSKIQAFNKDVTPYNGPELDKKKDKIEQTLSDMTTDMELLWNSGIFDKELIYNMVAQKYAPYIETLEGVNLNQFLEHASPKFKRITPNLIAEMFLDKNTDKYVKELVKNDLNEVLKPLIKEEKENDPNKRLRQTLSDYKEVPLEDFTLLLPLHSAEPVTNSSGEYNQGYMNKFIFNRPKDITTGPLGVRNILDSDIVQGLDLAQKVQIAKAILDEEMYHSVSDLMSVDKKLSGAIGWLVVNTDTGVTCMNRMTDGICEFADACYAFMGTMRPAGLKKQLEKMIFYSELGAEELANEISQRGGKVVRINQEGEFNSVKDFLKIAKVAELLPDVRFYGYTKNQDVLKEIIKNGLPENLVINDSLGRTHGAQYMSVPQDKIIDYLEAGYLLCKGACATCEQCLNDIKKVTILRDGSQTLGVEDVAHLNLKGQKVVFQTLKDYENAGVQVTRELTEEIIADVSAVSGMVRKNSTSFRSEGENVRLPELQDYFPLKGRRNVDFIENLGYGSLDYNVEQFLNSIDDAFIELDNFNIENGYKRLGDNHWGTRSILNRNNIIDHTHEMGSLTSRLENFGIYYNRKSTREAKETGIEEIVNLLNKDATKEAFMRDIISANQLKKWHKQLQDSIAVMKYGNVPWNLDDVQAWQTEKDEANDRLAKLIQERKQNTKKPLETTKTATTSAQDAQRHKQDKEIAQNMKYLLYTLVINKGQRGIIQKLLMKGSTEAIAKEIKRSNNNVSHGTAEKIANYLVQNPHELDNIRDDKFKFFRTDEDFVKQQNAHIPIENEDGTTHQSPFNAHSIFVNDDYKKAQKQADDSRRDRRERRRQRREEREERDERRERRERRRQDESTINWNRIRRDDAYYQDVMNRSSTTATQKAFADIVRGSGIDESMQLYGLNNIRQFYEDFLKEFTTEGPDFLQFNTSFAAGILQQIHGRIQHEEASTPFEDSIGDMFDMFDDIQDAFKNHMNQANQVWRETGQEINMVTRYLTLLNQPLQKVVDTLPILSPILMPITKAIDKLSQLGDIFKGVEYVNTVFNILNQDISEMEATRLGFGDEWIDAQVIKNLFGDHPEAYKKIVDFSEVFSEMFDIVKRNLYTVIGDILAFVINNIAIIAPITAGIAVAVGALWLSERNHAKALKEATEEREKAQKNIAASYATYKSLHEARQNETDAMKRQQIARRESIALYHLEADRIKQLSAINKESELRGDGLWGEYGERARMQKTGWLESILAEGIPFLGTISKWFAGDFESQYEKYEGSTGEIRRIRENALTGSMFGSDSTVAKWYDAHTKQLGQIEAFAPQLQELYDTESNLIDRYGSKEAARNSKEFREAVQEFANATGLNSETAQKYLDYLQTEANVENARKVMDAEVQGIVAKAEANAMKELYGDEAGMGDLTDIQDSMVYATANEIFKDAYNKLYWEMLMEWLAAIWNAITLNLGESWKHAKAAKRYQDGMVELMQNQKKITEDGFEAANADERKDYGNESYSYYNDAPFGGATESSQAMKEDWAEEKSWSGKSLYRALKEPKGQVYDNFANTYGKKTDNIKLDASKTELHIHSLNINTDDDPEKIKTAFMELIVELSDQVSPRAVSRTTGNPNNSSNATDTQSNTDTNDSSMTNNQNNQNTNINRNYN